MPKKPAEIPPDAPTTQMSEYAPDGATEGTDGGVTGISLYLILLSAASH